MKDKMALLVIIFLIAMIVFAGQKRPENVSSAVFPFAVGNDTLFTADTVLQSNTLHAGTFEGAWSVGFKFNLVGDSLDFIRIYYKSSVGGLGWGVPSDSIGVDSLQIFKVDTAYVRSAEVFWINMAKENWWGWHDEGQLIIATSSDIDTIYVQCRTRGF